MSNVTKLHLVLILAFVFSLSGLAIELLYLLYRRRLRRSSHSVAAVDPELQGHRGAADGLLSSRWTLLPALCFKKQPSSRVEPASATPSPVTKPAALAERETVEAAADEEDCDLTRWQELCLGTSRLLYTIDEEVEEAEEEDTAAGGDDDDGGGGTPFYTPASSPPREPDEAGHPAAGEMPR